MLHRETSRDVFSRVWIATFLAGLICAVAAVGEIPDAPKREVSKPEVSVTAEPIEITIGDRVTVTVTTIYDPERIQLAESTAAPDLGTFQLKDIETDDPETLEDGRAKRVRRYIVSTYVTGDFEVPPMSVAYRYGEGDDAERGTVSTPAVPIHVRSLTAEESEELTIRGPKSQLTVGGTSRLPMVLAATGLVLVLIAAFVLWLMARRRRERSVAVAAKIPPHERALADLAELRDRVNEVGEDGAVLWTEAFTDVLREYILGVWDIDAPDMTTIEIVTAMRAAALETEVLSEFKSLFKDADAVKFAQQPVGVDDALASLQRAETLIERTRPGEESAEEASNGKSANETGPEPDGEEVA